jgi:hypothetical protein
MADDDTSGRRSEDGFELDGTFYRWALSDQGKDLMLIDRFTQLPVAEFFAVIEDGFDRGRGPVLLAMIATSVRAGHPDWTVERIARLVMNTNLSDIEFVGGEEAEDERPPATAAEAPPPETSPATSDGSSSSSTLTAITSSRTSSAGQG